MPVLLRRGNPQELSMPGTRTGVGLALIATVLAAVPAWAGGDNQVGAELADRHCARCHAVSSGPSPVADAPAFRRLARKWPIEYLAEALAEGIVTSHRHDVEMPEFVFTPEEIDALLAYLESIQE